MKRLAAISVGLLLQGLNAFGQTNSVPAAIPAIPPAPAKSSIDTAKDTKPSPLPQQTTWPEMTNRPPPLAAAPRSKHETPAMPPGTAKDQGATLDSIFHSGNDQMGDNMVRDTYVTIFPTWP